MWLEPSLEDQELLADTLEGHNSGATRQELAVDLGFLVAAVVLWCIRPPHGFALAPALMCVLLLALATMVSFDTPFGFTVPTQLAFVPLLFALPVALVPFAVAAAWIIAGGRNVLAGEMPPGRLLAALGNSWFAIGPVAVFAVAGTEPRDAGAALLLVALAAQFAVDFAVSAVRFSDRGATLASQLREARIYLIDAALSGVALVVAEDVHAHPAAVLSLLPLLGVLWLFAHERRRRLEGMIELGNAYRGTALVLGDVVEADDSYTGQHCKGVVGLALEVAEELGLDAAQRRNLEFAALLHDVGKIAIPKEIVNKPGKLDPHEWKIIKTHTVEGQRMLDRVGGFMRDVGLIVRSHHERWDGGGYPDGLTGESIPLEARIIACCDTWNAMRTDRSYRKALPYAIALAEIRAHSGSQFDPTVVEALVRRVEHGARLEANASGEGESTKSSRSATSLPGSLTPNPHQT